jgi:23S rRNA (guanosine2251-2'-O)-methyltransferase
MSAAVGLKSDKELFDIIDASTAPPFLLILDGIQDPHNLGACLRTAEAAGVHAVIVPKDRSVLFTSTVRTVACGAAEKVPLVAVTNLARAMRALQESGIWIVGTTGGAEQNLYDENLKGPLAIVMGAEGKGLRRLTRESCDVIVRIPMLGSTESLNVSVAAGVCLFEAVRQRQMRADKSQQ